MGTSTPVPTKITRRAEQVQQNGAIGTGVEIVWSDTQQGFISSATLRRNCPCASCAESRGEASHSAPLSQPKSSRLKVLSATLAEETDLQLIWPVGNYALGMKWADGHDSGIYSYTLLKTLMEA